MATSHMTAADMFEEAGRLLDLDMEGNRKEAVARARKLFKLMRRVDLHRGDACELYHAAMRVATLLKHRRQKLGLKVLRWAWQLDCDSKNEALYRYELGSCYLYLRGKEGEAAQELCRAVELLEPDHELLPVVCDNAALACVRIGDDARAVRYLRRVVEMIQTSTSYPDRYRMQMAHISIAESYWRMRRDEDAMALLDEVMELDSLEPGVRPMVYSLRGDIHEFRGEYEEAAEEYRKGIEATEPDIERRRVSPHLMDRESDVSDLRQLKKDLIRDLRRCERRLNRR